MIIPHDMTRLIRRGATVALTLEIQDDDGNQLSPTSATIQILDGAEEVVATTAVTSVGPPISYTLAGSVHSSRGLSEDWLEIWTPTIAGTEYQFTRLAHLVRRLWYPTVNDSDLEAAHQELARIRPDTIDSYAVYRNRAAGRIQRDLVKKGRRPWLILDAASLYDPHVTLSLGYLFTDWGTQFGQGQWKELGADYMEQYEALMRDANFRYDEDESGTASGADTVPARPPLVLTAGAPAAWRSGYRGYR